MTFLLVIQVFGWELKFSGNSVHPEVTVINSTLVFSMNQAVVGELVYNLDGEMGNPFGEVIFDFSFDVVAAVNTISGSEVRSILA